MSNPKSKIVYSATTGIVKWYGKSIESSQEFQDYIEERVRPEVFDKELVEFEKTMQDLKTTGMNPGNIEEFLHPVPESRGWEIGEALAFCLLADNKSGKYVLPWNTLWDKRTSKAINTGVDLVGFYKCDEKILLMLGEVKTSSDSKTPPDVTYSLIEQIRKYNRKLDDDIYALLNWLKIRCKSDQLQVYFKNSVSLFISSGGSELFQIGILLRDTVPNELDLKGIATKLNNEFGSPTEMELSAWYLPVPIENWPKLLKDGKS